jgi:flagellar motor switch protein FliM
MLNSGKKNKKKLDFTEKIPLFWGTVGKSGGKFQIRILKNVQRTIFILD